MELFKIFGPVSFGILAAGMAALVTGMLAVAFSQARLGAKFGVGSFALIVIESSLTLIGVMGHRIRAEHAAETLAEPERAQLLAAAHVQSAALAKLGAGFAGVALALAILGVVRGLTAHAKSQHKPQSAKSPPASARAGKSDDDPPEVDVAALGESSLGLGALVLGCMATFSLIATLMPLILKTEKNGLAGDASTEKYREAARRLEAGEFSDGCAALDEAYKGARDPKRFGKDAPGLVSECFEQGLERAEAAPDAAERDRVLASLKDSPLPFSDEQKKRLAEATTAAAR